ncbi:hypothetical protein AAG906_039605 [Vitis piasezkii]
MTLSLAIKLAAHLQQRNLLSLLLKHQTRRSAMQQLHSHLITTGAHHCMDVTSWNTLLRHYSLGIFPQEAFLLFRHLRLHHVSPPLSFNSFSFSFLLKACAYLPHRKGGLQLHALTLKAGFEFHVYLHTVLQNVYAVCGALLEAKQVLDEMPVRNSVTWNVLITGLAKWGELHLARSLFDEMPMPTVVSWTTIIDGYTRMNQPKQALALFRTMFIDEGIKPTEITLLAIFPAISNLGALELCQLRASRVFGEIAAKSRNLVSRTSVISAFATHGMAKEALANFERMQKECLKPSRITFLSVLNACIFATMVNEYQMSPDVKHYGCLIDMLGRAGRLDEAEKMALEIPDDVVNVVIWRTLLGARSFHGNEMENMGDYVLLSNIFAGVGRFWDVKRVRRLMDERNASKLPGLSLV